ncbi:hypothetical protein BC828DRAFT_29368 [Blastocladiella britannica]|nr:hypothetical protein BC828DRAFT_29368 [Blastocladiella britannica]
MLKGMYVDELVKRPFVAPTVLGLIAHDGYSKAQNALMCLTVLCTASDEVSVQLLESDVLKSLQPCIVYGSSGLKVLAMVLLGQLLEVGFSVTRVVSSGLLPHVTKLAAAEPVAAKLLWQLIRLDTQHRFALGKPMPTTTQIKDLGVLGSEKTQDTVVKMVTAGDASIMEIGLRVVARVIGGRVPEAILDSLLTRGLFDALRKCLLQSSSADHVLDATTALLVLLNRGKITADAMHASVSQVLLHNLQIRIPEARDLLNKLYTATAAPTATKDINPVQLLSFIEMHRKLIALVRALQSCIGNAELYAKLAARHAFELGMIARQAVWFIGTLHNDATGAIYFHRGLSTTCARIQAAQKSGKAKSAPPEAQPTEKSLVSFRVAWFQLVKALSQLCVGMFQYEDLRKGLIKQELPGRLFLVHLITGVAFPLADFVQVIHHLPPAECLTTYHDVLHASAVSLFVSDPDPEKKHIPGLHRRVLAHTGAVGSTPVLEGPTVMRTRMVATPGCESTLEICESMPQCLSTNSWSAQTAMGSVGVSGSGQWRFRVLMSDSDHEAVHIGFARAGWTPRPSLRHEFAAVDPRAYLIGGGSGGARPIADGVFLSLFFGVWHESHSLWEWLGTTGQADRAVDWGQVGDLHAGLGRGHDLDHTSFGQVLCCLPWYRPQ